MFTSENADSAKYVEAKQDINFYATFVRIGYLSTNIRLIHQHDEYLHMVCVSNIFSLDFFQKKNCILKLEQR